MAHIHYKGTGKVHSFKGTLGDEGQNKIDIQGSVGAIAWRITKFEIIDTEPGTLNSENVVKIYRDFQSSVDGQVHFTEAELLGVAFWVFNHSNPSYATTSAVIFDNQIFSKNIYVTHKDISGSGNGSNYYIELEEVTVSAAGKAQLALAAARRGGDRP